MNKQKVEVALYRTVLAASLLNLRLQRMALCKAQTVTKAPQFIYSSLGNWWKSLNVKESEKQKSWIRPFLRIHTKIPHGSFFHQVSWTSVWLFSSNAADKQTNKNVSTVHSWN